MPKVNKDAQDAALNYVKTNTEKLYLCSNFTIPVDGNGRFDPVAAFTSATTAKLVTYPDPALPSPPALNTLMTLDFGATNGRKLVFAGSSSNATVSGTVNLAVWVNEATSTVIFINNVTSTQVSTGGSVTVNGFDIWEISDPV